MSRRAALRGHWVERDSQRARSRLFPVGHSETRTSLALRGAASRKRSYLLGNGVWEKSHPVVQQANNFALE